MPSLKRTLSGQTRWFLIPEPLRSYAAVARRILFCVLIASDGNVSLSCFICRLFVIQSIEKSLYWIVGEEILSLILFLRSDDSTVFKLSF